MISFINILFLSFVDVFKNIITDILYTMVITIKKKRDSCLYKIDQKRKVGINDNIIKKIINTLEVHYEKCYFGS